MSKLFPVPTVQTVRGGGPKYSPHSAHLTQAKSLKEGALGAISMSGLPMLGTGHTIRLQDKYRSRLLKNDS